jgi:hypothetical protein
VPAANILNVLGVVNGETTPTWKSVHDGTAPSTQAFGDSASAGTALTAAHRDHKHAMPADPTTDIRTADVLVGTSTSAFSGEIVVGTSPGGELGGTWASPTVDATHSGSAHHTQSHSHGSAGDGTSLAPVDFSMTHTADTFAPHNVVASHASFSQVAAAVTTTRTASTAFYLLGLYANTYADGKMLFRGDGTIFADVGTVSTPADYAEYLESATGEPLPVGVSVVLEGDKVRQATAKDDPEDILGVTRPRGASTVVGNAAPMGWQDRYLRDPFGGALWQDYEVWAWDEDGVEHAYRADAIPADVTVPAEHRVSVQQEQVPNPTFDPTAEYIARESRPEWAIVGLMGQVPMRKGQPVRPSWRRMDEVPGTDGAVEMWFVR